MVHSSVAFLVVFLSAALFLPASHQWSRHRSHHHPPVHSPSQPARPPTSNHHHQPLPPARRHFFDIFRRRQDGYIYNRPHHYPYPYPHAGNGSHGMIPPFPMFPPMPMDRPSRFGGFSINPSLELPIGTSRYQPHYYPQAPQISNATENEIKETLKKMQEMYSSQQQGMPPYPPFPFGYPPQNYPGYYPNPFGYWPQYGMPASNQNNAGMKEQAATGLAVSNPDSKTKLGITGNGNYSDNETKV